MTRCCAAVYCCYSVLSGSAAPLSRHILVSQRRSISSSVVSKSDQLRLRTGSCGLCLIRRPFLRLSQPPTNVEGRLLIRGNQVLASVFLCVSARRYLRRPPILRPLRRLRHHAFSSDGAVRASQQLCDVIAFSHPWSRMCIDSPASLYCYVFAYSHPWRRRCILRPLSRSQDLNCDVITPTPTHGAGCASTLRPVSTVMYSPTPTHGEGCAFSGHSQDLNCDVIAPTPTHGAGCASTREALSGQFQQICNRLLPPMEKAITFSLSSDSDRVSCSHPWCRGC